MWDRSTGGRWPLPFFGCVASLNVGVGRCLAYIRKRSQIVTESKIQTVFLSSATRRLAGAYYLGSETRGVIRACTLDHNLEVLPGEDTEIGRKGIDLKRYGACCLQRTRL